MAEKENVAAAISRAQEELGNALTELDSISAFDPGVVGFAAHALNNYLTVAGGTVELLQVFTAGHPDPQVQVLLEGLAHNSEMMHHTVSQLMTTGSTQNPKLRFRKWFIPTLIQRSCNYYQRAATRKQIDIEYENASGLPHVWTDPMAVAAVMDNLLSNAVKYSPLGRNIRVSVQGEAEWVVCRVQDEGPGLDAEDQAKLFQRGVRLKPQPTGGEQSAGFGLAVAKGLVDQLGGKIWCESEPGQGCCFAFCLPVYDGQVAEHRSGTAL